MTWPEEIVQAVWTLVKERWLFLGLASTGLALWLLVQPVLPALARRLVALVGVTGALGWGLKEAWAVKWLADDAYISFAFSKRFVEGHGFVLNPGEYVEGYTNFLWVALLGVVGKLGGPIPEAALLGNLLCFVALVLIAWELTQGPLEQDAKASLPLAAIAVALSRPFFTFATSGLESIVSLTLCAGAALLWRRGWLVWSGVVFGLGAMTRPDHLLLAGAAWAVVVVDTWLTHRSLEPALRPLLRLATPTLAIFTAYWAWRWSYYGQFFPNTYYAKSGGGSYFSQGYVYLVHAFLVSGAVLAAFGLLWAFPWVLRDEKRRPLVLYAFAVAATHGLYVTKVGGDFMEFRFLLPTLFFVVVAWDVVTRRPSLTWPRWSVAALGLPLALSWAVLALNPKPIGPWEKKWHLAAEETFYQLRSGFPVDHGSDLVTLGRTVEEQFFAKGVAPKLAIGCIGMVGYFTHVPLMDTYGLANARVAKHEITARGRPGHEKFATLDDMLAEGAGFSDGNPWGAEREDAVGFHAGGRKFWLVRYDDDIDALARKENWPFPFIEQTVERSLRTLSRQQLDADRAFFEKFLTGSKRKDEVLARLDRFAKGDELRAVNPQTIPPEELPSWLRRADSFGAPELVQALSSRVLARFTFEDDVAPARTEGAVWPPVDGTQREQTQVVGYVGRRLLNTYKDVDRTTGSVELKLPAGEGQRVNLLVGGGNECQVVYVALLDGEREVSRWCGQRDEVLRPVEASLDGLAAPTLRIVDASAGAWGHLLVDDVLVYRAVPADVGPNP